MRVFVIDLAGKTRTTGDLEDVALEDCKLVWVDVQEPSDEERDLIRQFFSIHPLVLGVSRETESIPRIQEYDDHIMVVWNLLRDDPSTEMIEMTSLYIIQGMNYLVTIHMEDIPEVDAVFERLKEGMEVRHQHSAFLLYNIMNISAEEFFPLVEDLKDSIDTYMEDLFSEDKGSDLSPVMTLKHRNMAVRRTVSSLRDVVMRLARRDLPTIPDELNVYLLDVYDRLTRVYLEVDNNSDLISSSLDIHLSAVSNRLNVTMKRLTAIATFFMPATFVAGVYGMNFVHMPEYHWYYGYLFFWVVIVVITVVMVLIARKQDWL